jgi:hypothetical protein
MNSCPKKKSKSKYGVFGRQETKLDYGKRNQKTLRPGKARDASEREGENASAETEEESTRRAVAFACIPGGQAANG